MMSTDYVMMQNTKNPEIIRKKDTKIYKRKLLINFEIKRYCVI